MLHKPRGYITSRARDADNKIVFDLLPPEFYRRYANDRKRINQLFRFSLRLSQSYYNVTDGKSSQKILIKTILFH